MAIAEAAGRPANERPGRRRPFGVIVLALIHILYALLGLAAVYGVAEARPGSGTAALLEALGDQEQLYAIASIVAIVIAIGLWRLDRWAWYLAMTWTGIGLVVQILLYLGHHQSYLHMAVYVVEAFYLNQREVKEVFKLQPVSVAAVQLEDDRTGPE